MRGKIQNLTLIEVLVVICISVILALVILPALCSTRTPCRRNICRNNLKQIGLALRMYSSFYQSEFPDKIGRSGLQMLAETGFLENTEVYVCPQTADFLADSSSISLSSSYCYAGGLNESSCIDSGIAADRAKNHVKYGNILFIDGHVKGYAGASWSSNRGGTVLTDF